MRTQIRGLGLITDEHGVTLAVVTEGNGEEWRTGEEIQRANTALFAAAPAMLDDLREIRAILRGEHDNAHDSSAEQVDAALAVIEARLSSM